LFEEGTFVPTAKLTNKQKLSIATNYMGTPEAMYREDGEAVWTCKLNSYGKVRNFQGEFKTDCPFRYQGQYEDSETGLYYNRFRYYSPEEGIYISQDPIRLNGGSSLYSYVHDTNGWVDILGLNEINDKGTLGEQNSGIVKNTTRIPSDSGKVKYRVPDGMDDSERIIQEVKNVDKQYYSSQLKDDIAHVTRDDGDGKVILIVDNRTKITAPLQEAIDDPDIPIELVRKDLNSEESDSETNEGDNSCNG
jgi:RHS repeat-associated protein